LVSGVRILGIDPGFGRCGWGIVDLQGSHLHYQACGVIQTPKGLPLPQRLEALHSELEQILRDYAPAETAVEELFFAKNVKTAIDVGQARGVIVLTCAEAGLPVMEYKPAEIKLAVSGYGAATKPQIQQMVRVLLSLKDPLRFDDAADALAVAICHAHARNWRKLETGGGRTARPR
jgi:crossover junction endodeoxyribonuclease RuvC